MQTGFVRFLVGFGVVLAPLSACGGLVDSYDTPSSSLASGESATNPLDDAGARSLPADAAIAVTSPTGCDAPALTCNDTFPGAVPYSSATADALVGVWIFCPTALSEEYPTPNVGEEYAADGTHYAIIQDGNGNYVRDLDPESVGHWKASVLNGGGPGLFQTVITTSYETGYGIYGMSTCPRSLVSEGVLELPAR